MGALIAMAVALGIGYFYAKKKQAEAEAAPPALPPALPVPSRLGPSPYPEFIAREMEVADHLEKLDGAKGACSTETCVGPTNPPANPTGDKPQRGIASNPIRQWCVVVAEGDTAGRIAEYHVGDRSRYTELLAANPLKKMFSSPEVNFADLCVGERLFLPKSWNPWIDQAGVPAGHKGPYPPFDRLPPYPPSEENVVSAGYIAWPPEAPTTWAPIPFKMGG